MVVAYLVTHNFVTIRLTATLLGNRAFCDEIGGVFGGLLKGEKHPFHSKKIIQIIGIAPVLDN